MNSNTSPVGVAEARVPEKIVGWKEMIGYATGDTASCLYFKVFSSYLMIFYTDVVGIAAGAVSLMFVLTRIFDAVNDPIMGVLADRTNTRHGKFRPWLRWMVIPYAITGVAVFTVPDWSDAGKIVYMYITYTLVMVVYTMINIPYGALMGVMTPHSSERTALASYRFYGAYIGNIIVQSSILILVAKLGGGNEQWGHVQAMTIYAIGASLLFLWTFYATKERVPVPAGQEIDLRKDLAQLRKNKPWIAILVIGVTTILWIATRDAAILYYFKYYVGDKTVLATWFMVLGTVGTLAGVACTKWFTKLFRAKRTAFIGLTLLTAAVATAYYFADPEDVVLIFAVQILTSFLMGPLMPLFWSMIADTADYAEWKFGRRFTGLIFSAGTFSQKVGWAIGPAFAGMLLVHFGYEANVDQAPETLRGLKLMMSFIPSALGVIGAALVLFYGIDRKMEEQMERELMLRKAGEIDLG